MILLASKRSKICFEVLKVATLEKFHLRGVVGNQDPGDLGGGLTMDDTMKLQTNDPEICSNSIFWKRVWN